MFGVAAIKPKRPPKSLAQGMSRCRPAAVEGFSNVFLEDSEISGITIKRHRGGSHGGCPGKWMVRPSDAC